MKIRLFSILIIACCFLSCKKEKALSAKVNTNLKAEVVSGNNQSGYINQELPNEITIRISDLEGKEYFKSKIYYSVLSGNGLTLDIPPTQNYPNRWLLGCTEGKQELQAIIHDEKDQLIATLIISAFAQKHPYWNRSCGLPQYAETEAFHFSSITSFCKLNNGQLALLTGNSIYTSSDKGKDWMLLKKFDEISPFYSMAVSKDGSLLVSGRGIYKSADNGKSWDKVLDDFAFILFPLNNGDIYASSFFGKTYRSYDNGNTWQQIFIQCGTPFSYSIVDMISTTGDSLFVITDENNLISSKDRGNTWELIKTLPFYPQLKAIVTADNVLYVRNEQGIYTSTNFGMTWEKLAELYHDPNFSFPGDRSLIVKGKTLFALNNDGLNKVDYNGKITHLTDALYQMDSNVYINSYCIINADSILIGDENASFYGSVFYNF